MLEGLLGRNFSAKCKASIKLIRTRIDVIRRKRNATQKFLKKDVADLLTNGLDINAYGRAEGLIAELTISSCYDFIEHSCECVLKHLSVMQKQSECPEECRTAVASLMFAAARFSDLPELRDLRHVFQEKYGNSLEYFVNQKFVENLASKPSTMEKKIQLMQGIASEFSIRWDSKAFERTMSKPPVSAQDQPKQYRPSHVIDDRFKLPNGSNSVPKGDKIDALPKERHEVTSNGHRSHSKKEDSVSKRGELDHQLFGRHDVYENGQRPLNGWEENIPKRDGHGIIFQGRQQVITHNHETLTVKEDTTQKTHRLGSSSRGKGLEPIDGGYKLHNGRGDDVPKKDSHDTLSPGKQEVYLHNGQLVKGDGRDVPFAGRNNHAGREVIADKRETLTVNEDTTQKTHRLGNSSRGKRLEPIDGGYKLHNGRGDAVPRRDSHDILSPEKEEFPLHNERYPIKGNGRDIPFDGGYMQHNGRGDAVPRRESHDILSPEKQEFPLHNERHLVKGNGRDIPFDGGYKLHNGRADAVPRRDSHDILSPEKQEFSLHNERQLVKGNGRDIPFASRNNHGGRDNYAVQHKIAYSIQKVQAEETDGLKLYNNAMPPPYVKPPRASKRGTSLESNVAGFDCDGPNGAFTDPSAANRTNAGEKSERIPLGSDHPDYERQVVGPVRVNGQSRDKEHKYHDGVTGDPLPKPRSVRRRHSKSSSSHADIGNPEDRKVVKRISSGRRRGDPRQGLQIAIGDEHYCKDDEERMMDKLLLHYSKKPSTYDPEKLRRKSKAHPSHNRAADGSECPQNGSNNEQDESSEMVPAPVRSVSLPHEQIGPSEATKVFTRAASFQPDRSSPAQHVHPNLPDYDDLAARFAALKRR